jgi:hypothetical protein
MTEVWVGEWFACSHIMCAEARRVDIPFSAHAYTHTHFRTNTYTHTHPQRSYHMLCILRA